MICKKCVKKKHYKCKNGPWAIGTWCACQHRIKISPSWEIYLTHKYGSVDNG